MDELNDNRLAEALAPLLMKRRDLLPLWIKIFIWIFMIAGIISLISFVFGLFGTKLNMSIYGLEATTPLSIIGIIVFSIYFLKGAVALGLWTGKAWAVDLAKIDAIAGILLCILALFGFFISNKISFRLELLVLIPYLIKMRRISSDWQERIH